MKIRLTESALISLIERAIVDNYGVKKNLDKQLKLSNPGEFYEHEDDRPDNWRELPGYNPDYFYDDDSLFGKETDEDNDIFNGDDAGDGQYRSDRDRLKRNPNSAKARFRAGLGKSL